MQRVDERVGFGDPLAPRPLAQAVEQARGGGQPDVGEQQRLLELVPRVVVDRAAAANRGERPHERGARLAQPVAEARRLDDLDLVDDLGLDFLATSGTTSTSGSASSTTTGFGGAGGAGGRDGGRPAAPDAGARPRPGQPGAANGGTGRGRAR